MTRAVWMNAVSGRFSPASLLLHGDWVHTVKMVGASLLAMDVNDVACGLDERGAWAFFASKPAPTGDGVHTVKMVGASLLAMDVNDVAGGLDERGVRAFFASKPAPTRGLGSHDSKL